MASATITVTFTRESKATFWPYRYVDLFHEKDSTVAPFVDVANNATLITQMTRTPPFVIDTTYGPESMNYTVWGEELGGEGINSLSGSFRYLVSDISQIPGWTTDSAGLLALIDAANITAARTVDSSGALANYWTWMTSVYYPNAGITRTATVVVS